MSGEGNCDILSCVMLQRHVNILDIIVAGRQTVTEQSPAAVVSELPSPVESVLVSSKFMYGTYIVRS